MPVRKIYIEALHRSAARWTTDGPEEVCVDSGGQLSLVKSGRGTRFGDETLAVNVADRITAKYPQMVVRIFEEADE